MTRFAHNRLVTSPSLQPDQPQHAEQTTDALIRTPRGRAGGQGTHRGSQRSRKAARRERSRKLHCGAPVTALCTLGFSFLSPDEDLVAKKKPEKKTFSP